MVLGKLILVYFICMLCGFFVEKKKKKNCTSSTVCLSH